MSTHGLFVAGTDTGSGKTRTTCGLLAALAAHGVRAVGMKPVATGAFIENGASISDDALMIAAHSSVQMPMTDINPYRFEPPVSPDVAAALAGIPIEITVLEAAYHRLATRAEIVIVEGTGGWLTPIGPGATMADIPERFGTPVLLVVGLTLGCINHALLTAEAIRSRGCRLAGWIGNRIDPNYLLPENNLATLGHWLGAPALTVLSHGELPASTQELSAVCARLF